MKAKSKSDSLDFNILSQITDRAFYYALRMIHIANHRPNHPRGEPKVGGHPSACASSKHILSAIHLVMREPEDYMACKPHVSPLDHALNFLLHNFWDGAGKQMDEPSRRLAMQHLRHFSKTGEPVFQSYHAESDPDSFRFFPSGSVGIPPVNSLYLSLAYSFAKDHGFDLPENPTFWSLMGDSEFREGSLAEAMPDGGERQLGNVIWIVDYNRQNLDGTRVINEKAMRGTDADRIVKVAEANGWEAIKLKHGTLRERLFSRPGGNELKEVLDEGMTDFEFQALLGANNAELTRTTLGYLSKKAKLFIDKLSDSELHQAFMNLGGHDLESLIQTFKKAKSSTNRPTLIVAYTIKGHGLNCQALSGNHSVLPEAEELDAMARSLGIPEQDYFAPFPSSSVEERFLESRRGSLLPGISKIRSEVENRKKKWKDSISASDFPVDFDINALKFNPQAHTQWMWGQIAAKLDRLARGDAKSNLSENDRKWHKLAPYFITMAPDVGSSTNTSPNMNGKLYGDIQQEDFEKKFGTKDESAPDVIPHADVRTGHIRFEIAEGNCMSAAGSFGKFYHFVGIPFYPAMTIYDFFIKRAHDQFYYNLYWHSHFSTIGTPSGVTLAPEGAQHSWKSDFQIPNCVTWEPCFAKEAEWILAKTLKNHFTGEDGARESALIRCVTKGLPQKEFLTRLRTQKRFADLDDATLWETVRLEVLEGAYPLIDYRGENDYVPGDNVVHIFSMGALGGEAILASDKLKEQGIFANVFIVTSPDLLLGNYAEGDHHKHLKETLGISGTTYLVGQPSERISSISDWYSLQSGRIPILSVHDGEPGLLDNIGSIVGVKQKSLAIRKTSKSGTTMDIYSYHHIDAEGIVAGCLEVLKLATEERIEVSETVLKQVQTHLSASNASLEK